MDEKIIKDMYKLYWKYMISKDVDHLNEMMTDDYTLKHITGMTQSKEDFFQSIKNGELNYYSAIHDKIIVHVHENKATMIARSQITASVYGGQKQNWRLQGNLTLVLKDGIWKYKSSTTSIYEKGDKNDGIYNFK